jgi:uncharacterized protein YxjI
MGILRKNKSDDKRKFKMREKLMSIGDDYWIADEHGNKAFKVNGKAARVRDTWVLEDASGREVALIREKKLSVRDKIKIEFGDHEAVVKKELISIRDKFQVDVGNGRDLEVKGRIGDHEYKIERGGKKIAEISKKWFRVRDTYGVEIEHDVDTILVLCVTVAVDALSGHGAKD